MKNKSKRILCASVSAISLLSFVVAPSTANTSLQNLLSVKITNVEAASTPYSGTVTASTLNVRKGPGTNYSIVGSKSKGTTVTIYAERNGWGKISNISEQWVSLQYIKVNTSSNIAYVAGNGVNIRSGPGTSYKSVNTKNNGDQIKIYEVSNNWGRISPTAQQWISLDFTFTYPDAVSKTDFIRLCNCVAQEAGSDSISKAEKATVVEVIMNRLNDTTGEFKTRNTIKDVIKYGGFSGSSSYIELTSFSSKVTNNVIKGVLEYFSNTNNYKHNYKWFCAYKGHNYFTSIYPSSSKDRVTYTCPGVGTHVFTLNSNGVQIPT